MRLMAAFVLASIAGLACQKAKTENDSFQSTKLAVGVEEMDSSLNLKTLAPPGFVTKADLWCNDKLKASLDFTADQQSIELFSSLENCELRLVEFFDVGKYTIGSLFSPGVYEFELKDVSSNRVVDKKLVRSIQPIVIETQGKCADPCQSREIYVKFPHSVLDIKSEILVNEINVNELYAQLEKEDAPTCESFHARFVESMDLITPPSLEIVLKNCANTINTGNLEFAFGPTLLNEQGQLPGPINITDVMRAADSAPIVPTRNGNDYTILLSFDQLKERFVNFNFSTLEILTLDFAVIVRNKQGISGLVYLIDNQCKFIGGSL